MDWTTGLQFPVEANISLFTTPMGPGAKQPKREADHSHASSAEVKE